MDDLTFGLRQTESSPTKVTFGKTQPSAEDFSEGTFGSVFKFDGVMVVIAYGGHENINNIKNKW